MADPVSTITPDNGANTQELEALKKKVADLETQNKDLSEFRKIAEPIVQFAATNPDVKKTFTEQWEIATGQRKPTPPTTPPTDPSKPTPPTEDPKITNLEKKVDDVRETTRSGIIKTFETKYAFHKLPPEEASAKRKAIAEYAKGWGMEIKDVPTEKLEFVLENSMKSIDPDAASKASQAGYVQGYTNGVATMPSINGGSTPESDPTKLTEAQKKWAEKLNVDPTKAEEAIKNKENEYKTPSKAETDALKK
jgi:hypothetical protein